MCKCQLLAETEHFRYKIQRDMNQRSNIHKIAARKRPTQKRSLQTVEKILNGARALITESDGMTWPKITTNHIAKRAGISVGSLYQYFPNTEAILYELYKEILDRVTKVLDQYDSAEYLSLPRDDFLDRLNRALTDAGADNDLVLAIMHISPNYPALTAVNREHSERVATRMAGFLRHYGSSWPTDKLKRLVLYAYYIDHGTWLYQEHARPSREEMLEWEVNTINHLIMKCFED